MSKASDTPSRRRMRHRSCVLRPHYEPSELKQTLGSPESGYLPGFLRKRDAPILFEAVCRELILVVG